MISQFYLESLRVLYEGGKTPPDITQPCVVFAAAIVIWSLWTGIKNRDQIHETLTTTEEYCKRKRGDSRIQYYRRGLSDEQVKQIEKESRTAIGFARRAYHDCGPLITYVNCRKCHNQMDQRDNNSFCIRCGKPLAP